MRLHRIGDTIYYENAAEASATHWHTFFGSAVLRLSPNPRGFLYRSVRWILSNKAGATVTVLRDSDQHIFFFIFCLQFSFSRVADAVPQY
jgi:hypothetical protein